MQTVIIVVSLLALLAIAAYYLPRGWYSHPDNMEERLREQIREENLRGIREAHLDRRRDGSDRNNSQRHLLEGR